MFESIGEIGQTVWSATQASLSVILVLLYGYLSRRYKLMSEEGESNVSKISVTLFLPCLLFSEIGPLASWSNLQEYWVIVVYALFFQSISFIFAIFATKVLKFPQWIVPCMIFNNVTSLPLILLSSLGDNGTLDDLVDKNDTLSELMNRGKVYLLIHALVCNLTRFTFGPYLLVDSDSSDEEEEEIHESKYHTRAWIWTHAESPHDALRSHIHKKISTTLPAQALTTSYPNIQPYHPQSESAPLLYRTRVEAKRAGNVLSVIGERVWDFFNPPMIGGAAAVIGGVIPFLHKWLFGKDAWMKPLTESVSKLGDLYTVLQMFVLGAHLQSKRGSKPPVFPLLYLFSFRFLLMPFISCATVFFARKYLGDYILSDPILDFTMILVAVGPTAISLAAIVEMSDTDEGTDTAVAQTIVLSHALLPLISGTVTAALAVVKRMHG